ncbi:esterase-like activity of phytase family protein [Rhizobium sp.]
MTRHFSTAAAVAALLASTAAFAQAEQVFNRVASFPVASNTPAEIDNKTPTSAEIIAATEDGNTLVYTSSPLKAVGIIDITDAKAPKALGSVMLDGEPTSVAIIGGKALTAVRTSDSKTEPAGRLETVDIASKKVEASCDIGGQPDSVAISADKTLVAIAIENERDEEVNDGALPQLPAGYLVILPLKDGVVDCGAIKKVAVTGLAEIAPEDPEPEFVSFNSKNEIALTLQENNHIVIVDGNTATVKNHFSAGKVDLDGVDITTDGKLDFSEKQEGRAREPDSVKWLDDNRIVVANEGDYEGGARGFTIFEAATGKVLYEAGNSLELAIARLGHYPEKRSKAKGVEPEGLESFEIDGQKYFIVLTERASMAAVYKDTGAEPVLVQLLPSGVSPEGVVAIPQRKLFATANEVDLVEDGLARSHVMLYEMAEGKPAYPQLVSEDKDGKVIGWGALSGLAPVPEKPGFLYAVSDSVYGNQPSIFTIDATKTPAVITDKLVVKRDGANAQKLDVEGIANDGEGGFWLASEGNSEKLVPHALYHVDKKGKIKEEIALPAELLAGETRFGFEGIAVQGTGDDTVLWMAVQREWKDDPKGMVKLVSYKPSSKEWGAVRYPLEPKGEGWNGVSEIAFQGDNAYIIERDNQIGDAAKLKKLFRVALADLKPGKLGGELPVVKKEEAFDFIPSLKSLNGFVVDKIEGFTFDASGKAFAVTDNDGVDDSSGETLFFPVDIKGAN